ncbi:MAG: thiamine pyrophosphate-dependent dehydrogenase E1 component subunit alpha [Egibacteraceae bacterium]
MEPVQFLDTDGTLLKGAEVRLSDEEALAGLRLMMLSRAADRRAISLQRQGRLGTVAPVMGQEAAFVGSAMALDPARDWIVPQYREMPALLQHGYPLECFFGYLKGNAAAAKIPDGVNMFPIQIALGVQIPHAVGLAWGLRLRQGVGGRSPGDGSGVVTCYFGDGASSEGDFHEACNLAGIVKAPVVFFLSDNGWAISTPRGMQTAGATFAERGPTYGFPGVVVDGNDLFAVHKVTLDAVERARSGQGPTLIEARTYRMGAHTTADDPTRYVDPAERAAWEGRDPIDRVQRYLAAKGIWDSAAEEACAKEIGAEIDRAVEIAERHAPPRVEDLFEHSFARLPARLERQRDELSKRASP